MDLSIFSATHGQKLDSPFPAELARAFEVLKKIPELAQQRQRNGTSETRNWLAVILEDPSFTPFGAVHEGQLVALEDCSRVAQHLPHKRVLKRVGSPS